MIDVELSEEALGNNPVARSALFDEDDEQELKEITRIRKDLTKLLTTDENGKTRVPGSTSDKVLLAQLLDGRERQVMTKGRLAIAAKTEQNVGNLADVVAQALRGFKTGNAPARPVEREIPAEYLQIEAVPGEMDIGNLPMTIDDLKPEG